jgi:hypothetical protein
MNTMLSAIQPRPTKKEIRKMMYDKLALALADYRTTMKEKKFESNLKRASKMFAADLAKSIGKKKDKAPKQEKKKNGKKKKQETQELQVNHI